MAYFFLMSLSEVLSLYFASQKISNHWMAHFIAIIDYSFLMYVFSLWLENKKGAELLQKSIPVYWVLWVLYIGFNGEGIFSQFYITHTISSLALILTSFYMLYQLAVHPDVILQQDYRSWITIGVIFFYSGSLLVFSATQIADMKFLWLLWYFHVGFNILHNTFYSIGIWFIKYQQEVLQKRSLVKV